MVSWSPSTAEKNLWNVVYEQKRDLGKGLLGYIWWQYYIDETSVKWVLLFSMEIVQNISYFGYVLFLSCIFEGGFKGPKYSRK